MVSPVYNIDFDEFYCFQRPYQQNQTLGTICNQGINFCSSPPSGNMSPIASSHSLQAMLEKQKQELDYLLQVQDVSLRSLLTEQMNQQMATLLRTIELRARPLIMQKDEELEKVTKKTVELQESLRKVQIESDSWQRLTKEKEAMLVELQNSLEHAYDAQSLLGDNKVADAESFCFDSCEQHQRAAATEEKSSISKLMCKHCNSSVSCMLILPCRHLCSCKSCEALLRCCPVCGLIKQASMEVLMS